MDSVFSFVVGLLTAALSLLGFVQQHPELPQVQKDQAQQIAQQAITQATNALNTAPAQTTQTQNTTSNPTTIAAQTGTKTYTNSQYGFSFQYPSNLSVTSPGKVYGEYSFHGFATQSVASVVSGPKSFSVYVSSNPNDVSNCLKVRADYSLAGYEGGNLAKMATINGVQFAVFNGFENAAMGRSENGTVYNTVKNNACYSIDVRSITNRDDTQAYINSGSIIGPIIDSFSFGNASVSQQSGVQVNGMTKYTDANFGFSFWYPSGWSVQKVPADTNSSHFQNGSVVAQILINGGADADTATKGGNAQAITIQEFTSSERSIGIGAGACFTCAPVTYYFDTTRHQWMKQYPQGNSGDPMDTQQQIDQTKIPTPADVSNNTMGGLHIFSGSDNRFGSSIVPLSARNFVYVAAKSQGQYNLEGPLVETIIALDPSVATPVSAAQQTQTIQAEANAYSY